MRLLNILRSVGSWIHRPGRGEFILRILVLAVPIGATTAVTTYFLYHMDVETAYRIIVATERHHMEMRDSMISQHVRAAVTDVRLLGKSYDLDQDNGTNSELPFYGLTRNFLLHCSHYPRYERLRLVDARGKELINVVCRPGAPYASAHSQLGPVPHLDMSKVIRALRRSAVFISEITTTRAPGTPDAVTPAIRFVAPLSHRFNHKTVFVVLELALRDIIPNLLINTGRGGTLLVVRHDGRFLHRSVGDHSPGAIFAPTRFFERYPLAWREIWKSRRGMIRNQNGLFTFSTLIPPQIAQAVTAPKPAGGAPSLRPATAGSPRGAFEASGGGDDPLLVWKLVSHVSDRALAIGRRDFEYKLLLLIPVIFVLPFIGVVYLANVQMKRADALHNLKNNEQYLTEVMNTVVNGIVTIDENGRIERCNATTLRLFGYGADELFGCDFRRLLALENNPCAFDITRLLDGVETETSIEGSRMRVDAVRKDATRVPTEIEFSVMEHDGQKRFLCVIRDISQQLALEEKQESERMLFFQQSKMAEIGLLAAHIIHEVGNPVVAIHGLVSVVRDKIDERFGAEGQAVSGDLNIIVQQTERLSFITRDVTDFVRQQPGTAELFDLNSMVRSTSRLIRYDRRWKQIALAIDLDKRIPAVYGIREQIAQVLMNLLVNASDAVQPVAPGARRVTISTVQEGDRVVLAVTDNGQGMKEETRQHIFDSFFTTKPPGQGTGLGLALCKNIVSAHGGEIQIVSSPGEGSAFRVYLPITEPSQSDNGGLRETSPPTTG